MKSISRSEYGKIGRYDITYWVSFEPMVDMEQSWNGYINQPVIPNKSIHFIDKDQFPGMILGKK